MKKILIILFFMPVLCVQAQWRHEIGLYVGGSNYSGDIGREVFIYPNKWGGGIVYKRLINTRLAIRASGSYYGIYDNDQYSANIVRRRRNLHFANEIIEFVTELEINYFDYDITKDFSRFSPYMFLGIGGIYFHDVAGGSPGSYVYSHDISYTIPFGLGMKYGLSDRISMAGEVRARYALTDKLDYNNTHVATLRFGNPDTNDWYFFTGVSLIYSFGRQPCAVEPRY